MKSKGHMIILGGAFDRHDAADVIQLAHADLENVTWPSVKRAHGAHRIATSVSYTHLTLPTKRIV